MRTVTQFPHPVREIENLWIPLADGTRLAARVWLPSGAASSPVPAILEYIPYRKRDFTRARDEGVHAWFAGHGYASIRVDLRGSGDSEGLLEDEYLEREHDDAVQVIGWIARQPWCDGAVGMMGISWGGINALQVAARRPPELRAILTLCSTDDRYADDAHYMGGCLLQENLIWGSVLLAFQALPPDPEVVGDGWRERWKERLEALPLFPAKWLRHPWRDEFWRHGSVCEDPSRIEVPVYAMGGWADAYSNAVPRLLARLTAPCKGLVGPWSHAFPHNARPGPAIGFLQEALRWWDRWLRGEENGIMDEPAYRVWMQESVPPAGQYDERPGRWVAEERWPSPRIRTRTLHLAPGGLSVEPEPSRTLVVRSPQRAGLAGGDWCAFGSHGDLPTDQREDDGRSLVFDSEPLGKTVEILGAPVAHLELTADRPVAHLAVRLCDVRPGGASTRVTYALLNLAHRDSHEAPTPLEPGRPYRVRVVLNDVAHAFPAGHRLRLAVSTAYWPMAWPAPGAAAVSIRTGASRLELPVRPPRPEDGELKPFDTPEGALAASRHTVLRPLRYRRTVERDLANDETVYTVFSDGGDYDGAAVARIPSIDLELGHTIEKSFRVAQRDPLSARARIEQSTVLRRGEWEVRVECVTEMTCTAQAFRIRAEIAAREKGAPAIRRAWDEEVERRLV